MIAILWIIGVTILLYGTIWFSFAESEKSNWPYYKLTYKKLKELNYVASDELGILYLNIPEHLDNPKERAISEIVIHPVGYIKLYGGMRFLDTDYIKYFDPYALYWAKKITKLANEILNKKI